MRKQSGGEMFASQKNVTLNRDNQWVQRVLGSRTFATVMQPGGLIKNSACVRRLSRRASIYC